VLQDCKYVRWRSGGSSEDRGRLVGPFPGQFSSTHTSIPAFTAALEEKLDDVSAGTLNCARDAAFWEVSPSGWIRQGPENQRRYQWLDQIWGRTSFRSGGRQRPVMPPAAPRLA